MHITIKHTYKIINACVLRTETLAIESYIHRKNANRTFTKCSVHVLEHTSYIVGLMANALFRSSMPLLLPLFSLAMPR